jgi:hypothetical protein
MNIPGFTAENALVKATYYSYRPALITGSFDARQWIEPMLIIEGTHSCRKICGGEIQECSCTNCKGVACSCIRGTSFSCTYFY